MLCYCGQNDDAQVLLPLFIAEVPEPTVLVDSGSPKVTKDLEKEPRAGLKEGGLTDEEKRKLIEQYDCESDDDEYPYWLEGGVVRRVCV